MSASRGHRSNRGRPRKTTVLLSTGIAHDSSIDKITLTSSNVWCYKSCLCSFLAGGFNVDVVQTCFFVFIGKTRDPVDGPPKRWLTVPITAPLYTRTRHICIRSLCYAHVILAVALVTSSLTDRLSSFYGMITRFFIHHYCRTFCLLFQCHIHVSRDVSGNYYVKGACVRVILCIVYNFIAPRVSRSRKILYTTPKPTSPRCAPSTQEALSSSASWT